MLTTHNNAHWPGAFDPGHCRTCAREAGLLDHYIQVQREEFRIDEAHTLARKAHRYALWGLWSSAASVLLAVVALLRI
jgi:hypothetical protein